MALLATPYGCAEARLPYVQGDLPPARDLFPLVHDAPTQLDTQRAMLRFRSTTQHSGVFLVRDREHSTYKVCLESIERHENALKRKVTLRFSKVPVRDDGGRVVLDEGMQQAVPAHWMETIRRLGTPPKPFATTGKWGTLGSVVLWKPSGPTKLERAWQVAIQSPIVTRLETYRNLVYSHVGIEANGSIIGRSRNAVLVNGSVAGKVRVGSSSFVHVTGDLLGQIDSHSNSTVIIDGVLRGVVRVASGSNLLIRGRVFSINKSLRCSTSSTVYLEAHISRAQLEQWRRNRHPTVHVLSSDLAPGRYENVGKWGAVVVGDAVWNELGRP